MRTKIYQINPDRDKNHIRFESLENLERYQGSSKVDASLYDEVFSAELDEIGLEDIYHLFNTKGHPLHRGHSLSVSDVVVIEAENLPMAVGEIHIQREGEPVQRVRYADLLEYHARIAELTEADIDFKAHDMMGLKIPMAPIPGPGAYFCDSFGFQKIDFDEALTQKPNNLMRVVYVEPHKPPYEAEIAHTLEAEQKAVGGLIEPIYNGDGTCLVGNEEAKLIGMEGNRRIGDGSSIMAGPFFICGEACETFRSLTDEEVVKYMARFAEPEDISPEEVEADTGFFFYPVM